jgi:crotonobetainyl-CoA:carnitine CoA-transferase CaiB-like acyl-CoA transferase
MSLPLSGLLVVSLEQAVAAPMCTCRLADAGARVIKVERPEGDFARYYDKLAVPRAPKRPSPQPSQPKSDKSDFGR